MEGRRRRPHERVGIGHLARVHGVEGLPRRGRHRHADRDVRRQDLDVERLGAPNIYPVVDRASVRTGTVTIDLSPGLSAYSFTFG
nr:hypothetical protein [Frondihabitans sucicola]